MNCKLRYFERRVLRRIFGSKKKDITRRHRPNEQLHNFHSSPNFNRVIKPRRKRLAGHVARMGAIRNLCKIMAANLKMRYLYCDGRIILKWIFSKYGLDFIHLAQVMV
jgi:hypothetical protein